MSRRRNTISEMREVLDAIEAGRAVQWYYEEGRHWFDNDEGKNPDFGRFTYRVKPSGGSGAKSATAGCEVCLDEKPFLDKVNRDKTFFIRGCSMYVVREESRYEGDVPMCFTEAVFRIRHCPVCGRKLGKR